MGEFSIRDYTDDDLPAVLALMRASLGESERLPRTPELFRWKHEANPFGRSILLVAEADGGIVGLRAFMRWELVDAAGNVRRCVRPVDTATHPSYQRRGIFRALTEEAVEAARTDDVDLIFNTPNRKSAQGYLSMGWQRVGSIGVLVRPLPGLVRSRGISNAVVHRTEVQTVSDLSDDRAPRGLRTPRTDAYLDWRFRAHPSVSYAIVGDAAGAVVAHGGVRRGRSEVVVVDLMGADSLHPLRSLLRSAEASYAVGWFSKGSPERGIALRAGLVPVPGIVALSLVARPLTDVGPQVADLASWDLAMSDLELL